MSFTKINAAGIGSTETITINGLNVTGNASIGGTLTYEDVTNIDSVGLITARDGISITGGNVTLTGGGSFTGDGSGLTGIAATDNVRTGILDVAGIATFRSNTLVGSGITLSPDGDGFFTGITTAKSASFGGGVLQESFHNDTSPVSGNYYHDVLTHGMVYHGATNAGSNYTFGIRGDASTTFDSLIEIGKSTTFTLFSPNNNTGYYMAQFQIDGVNQTVKYAGGSAPSAATGSGVDVYTFTIFKTAASTYSVFGNFTNFA